MNDTTTITEDLMIPLNTEESLPPLPEGIPTIDEAKKAREDELAAMPLPPGTSEHVLSTLDREPVRPFVTRVGRTVIRDN